jgi:acetylornithine deacetylase
VSRPEAGTDLGSAIDDWVAGHRAEIVESLADLVAIPSVSRPPVADEAACQKAVERMLRTVDAEVDVFDPIDVEGLRTHPLYLPTWDGTPRSLEGRPNVVGRFRGSGGGRSIVLSTHIDTVAADESQWTESRPFLPAVRAGRLYGRGSWDAKWGIPVGLAAVRCLRDTGTRLAGDVIVESVVDEEFGGSHGTLAARLRGYEADIAIVSEPTGMVPALTHRAGGEWRITVRGDGGLAFDDKPLVNPVFAMARVVDAIRAFDTRRNERPSPQPLYTEDPLLPAYITQIAGGGTTYGEATGVPSECHIFAWIEEYPATTREEHIEGFVDGVLKALADDPLYEAAPPIFTPTIRCMEGSEIAADHPFLDHLAHAFQATGVQFAPGGAPFAADTYVFNCYSTTPALTLGPRGGNAHGPDEFVELEDLFVLVRILARSLATWCG